MAEYTIRGKNKKVRFSDDQVAHTGGEGRVFIRDDIVYKICHPGHMIPEGKFQELSKLTHPKIVQPQDILLDKSATPCGYTMKKVPGNAMPLARILTKAYRTREKVEHIAIQELVKQIADGIRYIHQFDGYLQVDGNELNYMVTEDYKDIYFIDVNSFQTPSFPATAIMPSIRDYQCRLSANNVYLWDHNTDWFSFAIVSFNLFTAIHPFKGINPRFTDPKTRFLDHMKASVSVLDPETEYQKNAAFTPFEDFIPGGKSGAYMQWYKALFVDKKRMPPPKDFQSMMTVVTVKRVVGSNKFDITELEAFDHRITSYLYVNGLTIIATDHDLICQQYKTARPSGKVRLAVTPLLNIPVAVALKDQKITVTNIMNGKQYPVDFNARDIMMYDGRVYLLAEDRVSQLEFIETNDISFVGQKLVANVLPSAVFHNGCAFQDMMGIPMISIFPQSQQHISIPVKELKGRRLIDAKYERNVLMLSVLDQKTGDYSRLILRFDKSMQQYDIREITGVTPVINFTVLDNGICASMTENMEIELFSSSKDAAGVKVIADPTLPADMHLCRKHNTAQFVNGNKLYSISVKK